MPSRSKLPEGRQGGRRNVSPKLYDNVETQRAALLDRLIRLREQESANAGYKSAQVLLNQRFRSARMGQRIQILKAAHWLIRIIEMKHVSTQSVIRHTADPS